MKKKLRIGLMMDSLMVPSWVHYMLSSIQNSEYASIDLIILNHSTSTKNNTLTKLKNYNYFLFKFLMTFENSYFKSKSDPLKLKNLSDFLEKIPTLKITPIKSKFSDKFSEQNISEIKQYDLDVLLRLGFRILRGDILHSSRYGVWSYHHGDDQTNRGGPAGFWEVLLNQPVTGTILQILNEDLDGGKVLYKSFSTTNKFSINRNRENFYWKSASFVPRILKELFDLGNEKFFKKIEDLNSLPNFYDSKMYTAPTNKQIFSSFMKYFLKNLISKIDSQFYFNQWIIMYYFGKDLQKSFWRYKPLNPPKDRFWADPFIINHNGCHYIFFEEYIYSSSKGHISVIEFEAPNNFKKPVTVLEKPFHLSYPFIFEYENEMYMIPESASEKSLMLFKSTAFPNEWEFKKNLLSDITCVDPTLLNYNNKWWLFVGTRANDFSDTDELSIFFTDDPVNGIWTPHPQNPVISDVRTARPAGKIFQYNDSLIRPSQNASNEYGSGISLNKILVLNENEYLEKQISSLEPNWDEMIKGFHTLNFSNGLSVIDAKKRRKIF